MNYLLCLLLLATQVSCTNKLKVNDFLEMISKDEDFVKTATGGDIHITVSYKPAEYMALTEMRDKIEGQASVNKEEFKKSVESFRSSSYFSVKLGLNDSSDIMKYGIADRVAYANRLNDLTFNSGRYAYFLSGTSDTIRASIFDLQRSFGYSNDLSILFAFPERLIRENDPVTFVYDDAYFGLETPVSIEFDPKKLKKRLPEIILNSHP